VAITTPEVGPDRARVRVEVELDNHAAAANAEIRVTLRAPGGARLDSRQQAVRLSPGETGAVTAEFVVPSPALWSLESPALHAAEVELLVGGVPVDRRVIDFGIRSIEVSGAAGFRLNGRSVKLRGVNLHQDLGALGGVSIASAELRRVRILKAAGFNAIRTSHQPPSTSFLDACDRVGMIVIDELFDMWDGEKSADDYHTYFTEWWDRDVTAIVRRDRNHPCIVFWSLGNEVAHPAGAAVPGFTPRFNGLPSWGRAMATRIRALDPHRFVIQGGALGIATLFNLAGDSPQWDYFDLGDGHYQKDYGKWHLAHPDKAMIQTESWAAAIHADWKRVADNPYMVGDFIWTGWDYLGEVGVGAPTLFDVGSPARTEDGPPSTKGYPWVAAYCGDFDLIGQPKPQYFYRRVVWGDSPLEMAVERPAPAGKEQRRFMWSFYDELPSWTWDVPEGTAMKVRVYANGDEVRLLQDGRPPQTRKLTPSDELIATFSVPYAPGRLTAIVLSGGREVARRTLQTVGKPAALRLGAEAAQGPAEPGRLNHVLIEVVDAAGRAVPDAVVPVSLELGGQVELAGVANGNPRNATSFRQPAVHTFKGKALVILKSGGAQGTGLLLASAPGLKPARLRV
jgi:beta-galactosidase